MKRTDTLNTIFNRLLPLGHGLYYLTTGLWSIVSPGSFQRVTGSKVDMWLVKTVGALLALTGGILIHTGLRAPQRSIPSEAVWLAAGTSTLLAGSDVIYGSMGRIARIYLLEALSETGLLSLWFARSMLQRRRLLPRQGQDMR